jgi:formylglycine-generating enzyme required for sulfatase activity
MRGTAFLGLVLWGTQTAAAVDFTKDVAPIYETYCLSCHGAGSGGNRINLTSRQAMLESKVLVPGNPQASRVYTSVQNGSMPPGGKLPAASVEILRQWVQEGAVWPEGTALKVPVKSAPVMGGTTTAGTEMENIRKIRERILAREAGNVSAKPYSVTIPNTTIKYDMVPIPAGDFTMGAPAPAPKDEQPPHKVHVDAFWMQAHEVTWDEYRLFMFANQAGEIAHKDELVDGVSRPTRPYVEMSFGMGINGFPAISMTQHAANKYAEWLSSKTGEFYRLPTEAEWEYACRTGTTTAYSFGEDVSKLGDYAWFAGNSGGKYGKVATKKPNAWNLYDMMGNVMEWTLDAYGPYKAGPESNPWVKATQPYPHAVRGGSWNDPSPNLTCAARVASDPSWKQQDPQLPKSIWYETDAQWLGFRLVRPAKVPSAEEMHKYWNNGVEHDEQ